ncbi:Cytochrome p450 protein [Hapsidospora chrysogenum ATCC 11550]|uniref:Cytochrome p450 protein n=1 Tax=Hapsidospora chrysogenum (strain ATCC 11550 / CBS 779.69 / DSM 880 / IAM 14645 / JCM 23072 / IMI 49137) TaxID=857340 RepID=A0A086T0X9_HAPC1|nr:Cytochrome p450 protein [Hapsidospora chrysogenum ATCC 11550]
MASSIDQSLGGVKPLLRVAIENPLAVIAALLLAVFTWRLFYALALCPLRNIPGPPAARLSALPAIYKRLPKRVTKAALADFHRYGDIYVSKPGTVTVCHPRDVRLVLGAADSWKMNVYKNLTDPVMRNLVTFSDPKLASRRRRQISPFLNSPGYLARMESIIIEHGIQALKKKWNRQLDEASDGDGATAIEINYRNDTQLATFNIMSALAFGRHHHSGEDQQDGANIVDWISATAVYIGVSINFKSLMTWPLSVLIRSWLDKYHDFVEYAKQSVKMRREALAKGLEEKPADMLQAFIDAEDPDSKIRMTSEEVQAESVGMQLAGSETTSASVTWALHLLTLYPDALRRATEEVRGSFGRDEVVTYADSRNSLPFLESLVYEVFRYAPITSGFMPRHSERPLELHGHHIPAGTTVAFNLLALNNRPDYWDEPQLFKPDRFLLDEEAKKNIFAFSYGPRSCVGRNLAWMEVMTILANLLKDYDVGSPENSLFGPENKDERGIPRMMPSQCHIVFAPTHPDRDCRLRISRRKD